VRQKQPISKGFSTGLSIWLLFLLSLFWIGYSAHLSIFLGAFGGLASGLIVDWWLSKDEKTAPDKPPQPDDNLEEMTKTRRKRSQQSGLQQRSKRRKQQQPVPNWFRQFGRRS
jgi:hypothetical protein